MNQKLKLDQKEINDAYEHKAVVFTVFSAHLDTCSGPSIAEWRESHYSVCVCVCVQGLFQGGPGGLLPPPPL